MAFSFGTTSTNSAPAPAAASSHSTTPRWYYYLQNDPHGKADGWYRYEMSIETTIESFYQNHTAHTHSHQPTKKARQLLPLTASSGYQYEVDFAAMTQRNTTSHKTRPIGRTTNGQPPQQPSFGAAAPAAAPAAATPRPGINATRQFLSSFGAAAPLAAPAAATPRLGIHATRQSLSSGGEQITYTAPESLHEVHLDATKIYIEVSPPSFKVNGDCKPAARNIDDDEKKDPYHHPSHDDDCCICLDSLWNGEHAVSSGAQDQQGRVVALKYCSHRFHYDCIHVALTKGGAKCPLCSKAVEQETTGTTKTSKGYCPDATMSYEITRHSCSGYPHAGTIQIQYHVPSGTQKSYHPHPGVRFRGAHRTSYLPATPEGHNLLVRMQYAFAHGLMFMVGTSLTTSEPNVVTWASIHNKTSRHGGTHGFPDPTYFQRANDELDHKGIPRNAGECQAWIQGL